MLSEWGKAAEVAANELLTVSTISEVGLIIKARGAYNACFANKQTPDYGPLYRIACAGLELHVNNSQSLIIETLCYKQVDYGHENISKFGHRGLEVRMHDKLARLEHLNKTGGRAKNEPIKDSWLDLAGYAVIGKMLLNDTFGLPLAPIAAKENKLNNPAFRLELTNS